MALSYTISKDMNPMYVDFNDAYWVITDLRYTTEDIVGWLKAYPSRECYKKEGNVIEDKTIAFGGTTDFSYQPHIWQWNFMFPIKNVFPNGIPLDVNQQKTNVYNFIKEYTQLEFKDVFED